MKRDDIACAFAVLSWVGMCLFLYGYGEFRGDLQLLGLLVASAGVIGAGIVYRKDL